MLTGPSHNLCCNNGQFEKKGRRKSKWMECRVLTPSYHCSLAFNCVPPNMTAILCSTLQKSCPLGPFWTLSDRWRFDKSALSVHTRRIPGRRLPRLGQISSMRGRGITRKNTYHSHHDPSRCGLLRPRRKCLLRTNQDHYRVSCRFSGSWMSCSIHLQ